MEVTDFHDLPSFAAPAWKFEMSPSKLYASLRCGVGTKEALEVLRTIFQDGAVDSFASASSPARAQLIGIGKEIDICRAYHCSNPYLCALSGWAYMG